MVNKLIGPLVIGALVALTSCDNEGVSTADIRTAAENRVAESLGLSPKAALFTNVFVGDPGEGALEGDLVVCGTVEGTRADGTPIPPRRFIAATDPGRWVRFDRVDQTSQVPINNSADWPTICAGEDKV